MQKLVPAKAGIKMQKLNKIVVVILGIFLLIPVLGLAGDYQITPPSDNDPVVTLTTSQGVIKFKLFSNEAPRACENFWKLAEKGYYNGLIFHRVIKDFMIQTGDPKGDGTGGESVWGEPFEDEFSDQLKNIRGAVSMANSGENTNGSQFFICQKDQPSLDNKHTVFGQVYEGIEVVDKIASAKTDDNDKPVKEIKIEEVETSGKFPGWFDKYGMTIIWVIAGAGVLALIIFVFIKTRRSGMTRAERRRRMK